MFHFDLDGIVGLRFLFIWSNEIVVHRIFETSHQVGAKPQELLNEGYSRISEEKIKKHYKKDILKKICGPKGTVLLVIQVAITEASLKK